MHRNPAFLRRACHGWGHDEKMAWTVLLSKPDLRFSCLLVKRDQSYSITESIVPQAFLLSRKRPRLPSRRACGRCVLRCRSRNGIHIAGVWHVRIWDMMCCYYRNKSFCRLPVVFYDSEWFDSVFRADSCRPSCRGPVGYAKSVSASAQLTNARRAYEGAAYSR